MIEVQILWSSQSGRAKACARRTHRILQTPSCRLIENGDDILLRPTMSFDQYGPHRILSLNKENTNAVSTRLILFVSTTGDGEHCDSIRETWKLLLQNSLPYNQLEQINFALFCLGDRAYGPDAYCAAGRKLASRLIQLGAKPFSPIGYGDDGTPNGGVFFDLDIWLRDSLLPCFSIHENNTSTECFQQLSSTHQVTLLNQQNSILGDESTAGAVDEEWLNPRYYDSYRTFFSESSPISAYNDTNKRYPESNLPPYIGVIKSNTRITDIGWYQDTRHISIQIDGPRLQAGDRCQLPYLAGDIATILPSNSESSVLKFLSVLPKSLIDKIDVPLNIECTSTSQHITAKWPSRATLKGILSYCADIASLPEREDLRNLSFCCNPIHPYGLEQKAKLLSLSELSDSALFADYIIREKRTWADVLYDFDSIRYEPSSEVSPGDICNINSSFIPLSLEYLLETLPLIHPRHYSIASSPSFIILEHATNDAERGNNCILEICVNVVQGSTSRGRSYEGLCSSYLARLTPCSRIQLWIRPGSFHRLPLQLEDNHVGFKSPVLFIGAGTGIAPLRALIHEREAHLKRYISDQHLQFHATRKQDNILLFGCRKSDADFYYQKEWEKLVNEGFLYLLTAFSQQESNRKIYVQGVLREDKNGKLLVSHILERGGAIYIAGNCKMAVAVKNEICELLAKYLAGGLNESKRILKQMQTRGLFSIEAWG